jgi:hypothetical protein
VYAIIGILAIQVALGDRGESTDRQGALRTIADKPGGTVVLVMLVIGFFGYALWRALDAAFGHTGERNGGKRTGKRVFSAVRAAAYVVIAISVISFLSSGGSSGRGGGSSNPKPFTARLMEHGAGRFLVGAIGIAVIAYGIALVYRGLKAKFEKKLRMSEMSPRTKTTVTWLGRAGHTARGVVFGLVGVFLLKAAIEFDPDEAKGLDETLKTVAAQAYGQWLLGACAAGLLAFGVYSFFEARYRKL